MLFQKIFHSLRERGDFFFFFSRYASGFFFFFLISPPPSPHPSLPSLLIDWNLSSQQGATMCWEGEHLRGSDVDGGGGCGAGGGGGGGGVTHCFPGSFCLRHSPLMRVNEDKLV